MAKNEAGRRAQLRQSQENIEENAEQLDKSQEVEEQEFILSVKEGKLWRTESAIYFGINVNIQDKFGMTALHHAAAIGFRAGIRMLVNSGKCNYLIKDNKGRLASELAYEWGRDYAVGLLLQKKEARQAYAQSISHSPDVPDDSE